MAWKFDNPWGGGNTQNPWDINGAEAQKMLQPQKQESPTLGLIDGRPTISEYITKNYPKIHYFLYSFMSDIRYNPLILQSYSDLVERRVTMTQMYNIFSSIMGKSINLIIGAAYDDHVDYNKRNNTDIWASEGNTIPGIAIGEGEFDNFYGGYREGYVKDTNPERPRGMSKYGTIYISKSVLSEYNDLFKSDCFAPTDINRAARQLGFAQTVLHELAHYVCYIANYYPTRDQADEGWDNGAEWENKVFGYTQTYDGITNKGYAKGLQGNIDYLKGKNLFHGMFRGILYMGDCKEQTPYIFS